jgi:hypothetical protein
MFGPAFMRLLGLIRRGAGLTGPMPVGRKFMRLKTAAETAAIQPLGRLSSARCAQHTAPSTDAAISIYGVVNRRSISAME